MGSGVFFLHNPRTPRLHARIKKHHRTTNRKEVKKMMLHFCRIRKVHIDLSDPRRHLSSRMRWIAPSLTLAITALAARMARGEE